MKPGEDRRNQNDGSNRREPFSNRSKQKTAEQDLFNCRNGDGNNQVADPGTVVQRFLENGHGILQRPGPSLRMNEQEIHQISSEQEQNRSDYYNRSAKMGRPPKWFSPALLHESKRRDQQRQARQQNRAERVRDP